MDYLTNEPPIKVPKVISARPPRPAERDGQA